MEHHEWNNEDSNNTAVVEPEQHQEPNTEEQSQEIIIPAANPITSEATIIELYKAFRFLNEHYYSGKLPEPYIVITETARKKAYGWFTPDKVWKDNEESIAMHEIALSAEYMSRSFIDVMETLHHEMIHLYCHINDIKDTRKKGRYHTDNFKKVCLEKGFYFEREEAHDKLGWYDPALTEETIKVIEDFELNQEVFNIARSMRPKKERKANKSKYCCYECNVNLRGKRGLSVVCGDCHQQMEEVVIVPKGNQSEED